MAGTEKLSGSDASSTDAISFEQQELEKLTDGENAGNGAAAIGEAGKYGDHPAAADVEAADRQLVGSQFGHVTQLVHPFTQQVRQSVRALYPDDKVIYDKADQVERRTVIFYAGLRIFTFLLFVFFVCFSTDQTSSFLTGEAYLGWMPIDFISFDFGWGFLQPFTCILIVGLTLVGLRNAARVLILREIAQWAERFAHDVSQRYSDTVSRTFEMSQEVLDRITEGMSWSESAELYAKASLWNAKRAEYLDRYSTNIAWKNQWFFLRLEFVTFSFKFVLATVLSIGIMTGYTGDFANTFSGDVFAKLLFVFAIFAFLHFGWGYAFRKRGDFWTDAFSKETKLQGSVASHYYNAIPRIIANLVRTVQANERNSN